MATAARLLLTLALLGAFAGGQDFDLSDALEDPKKPVPTRKPAGGGAGDDLDLSDALGGHDPQPPAPRPPPRPRDPQKPDSRPAGGDFSNSDLEDAAAGGRGGGAGGGEGPRSDHPDPEGPPQALLPGLLAAAAAALAGGVSGFLAYQRRRLCFRGRGPAPV